MRLAVFAALFALLVSPAFAAGEKTYTTGHFAGELNGVEEGYVKPVEGAQPTPQPRINSGGLGTRITPQATLPQRVVQPVAPGQLKNVPAPLPAANANNASTIDSVRERMNDKTKDMESEDKTGNFEIQDLMQKSNQSQTLTSDLLKKKDDTSQGTIGNVK